MLLTMLVLFVTVDIVQLLSVPSYSPRWSGYMFLIGAYAFSRTTHYRLAVGMMIAICPLAIFTTIISSSAPGVDGAVSYLVLGLFLSSIFVSWHGVLLLAAINLVGLLLLPSLIPDKVAGATSLMASLAVNLIGAALVLISMRHRRQIEGDRQAELRGSEERLRQALAALRNSEERYALAARGANDGLWDWDLTSGQIFFSPRWKAMLGYAEDAISTAPEEWFSRIHPNDLEPMRTRLAAHARRLIDHFELEYRITHADGGYRYMLCRGLAIGETATLATRMVGSQTDITDRKLAEERLRHDALHDSLTSLPNRALFMDRLSHAMRRRRRIRSVDEATFAVLFLDLDRFKTVNDSLGHMVGDELLLTAAQKLQQCLRPNDTIARIGGDEFTILLDPLQQPRDATEIAERIQRILAAPIHIHGHEIFTSVSIGIALSGDNYERPEELLRDADTAMYQAKLQGRARYAVFDDAMHADALELLRIESDLRRALDRSELRVHYQPIVSLHTEQIVGFEALVRWQHPERGMIPPDMFIPVAEDTGMITVLGQIVLREACRQLAEWQAQLPGLPPLMMSVNLSAKQLAQPDLLDLIDNALRETGLSAKQLKLEILEGALIGKAQAAETLRRIKDLGVQISIDDFGTGYSSLSYLHQFPVDTLKIDRSFISQMGTNGEHNEIISAIVSLARSLGMEAIAEGIETVAQRDQLRELNCDYGQGWLFARALDQAAATTLVASLAG